MKDEWLAVVKEGVVTGLIGYAAVAIVMAIINVAGGHSAFYTPAVLGATLFYGITDPAQVQVLPAYVFAFNGLHLMAFLFFGVAGAWFAWLSDKGEQLWYPGIFFFVFVAFHLVGAAQMLATPARVALPDGEAWGAGILASVVMVAFLLSRHPKTRMRQAW